MRCLSTLACLVALSVCFAQTSAAQSEPATLATSVPSEWSVRADSLVIDQATNCARASGNLRIENGALSLTAARLELCLDDGQVTAFDAILTTADGLTIAACQLKLELSDDEPVLFGEEFELTRDLDSSRSSASFLMLSGKRIDCAGGACRLDDASGTLCPHDPPGYRVSAKEITLHRSGDIDLTRPVLIVGDTPVLPLPWLRFRPPGKAGFLPPRIGYDSRGGLIIGPAGYFPLGPRGGASGHVAARTAEGLEASTVLTWPGARLTGDYLLRWPDSSGRLRASTRAGQERSAAALDVDLVSDYATLDALASEPLERAVLGTRSQALITLLSHDIAIEGDVRLMQRLEALGPYSSSLLTGTAGVGLHVPLFFTGRFLQSGLDLELSRRGLGRAVPGYGLERRPTPPHTRLAVAPRFELPLHFGGVAARIAATPRYQTWLLDQSNTTAHQASMSANGSVAFPLRRRYDGTLHILTPSVSYRAIPWIDGSPPRWSVDSADRLVRGHGVEIALANSWLSPSRSHTKIALIERLDLRGLGNDESHPAYLFLQASGGSPWFASSLEASWDQVENHLSLAGVNFSLQAPPRETRIAVGGRWLSFGRSPQREQPLTGLAEAWTISPLSFEPGSHLEIDVDARAALLRNLSVFGGARIEVWPAAEPLTVWYGLDLSPACGCLSLGITANHRPRSPVPDVYLMVRLDP